MKQISRKKSSYSGSIVSILVSEDGLYYNKCETHDVLSPPRDERKFAILLGIEVGQWCEKCAAAIVAIKQKRLQQEERDLLKK